MKNLTDLTVFCLALVATLCLATAQAAEAEAEAELGTETVYVMIEPYLVTNFTKKNGRLGYINTLPRIITTKADEAIVENHMPMIKAYLVELLGAMLEEKLTDNMQRPQIQKEATEGLQKLFKEEVGKTVVTGVLFKKFLTM